MMAPICEFCPGQELNAVTTLRFADYRPLPEGMVGHPRGLVWVCAEHLEAASQLTHLSAREARSSLALGSDLPR